jgi:hypothetical protein
MGHEVLQRRSEDSDALFLLGSCHFARGDNAAAAGFLGRFLRTNPEVEAATEAHGMLQIIDDQIVSLDPDAEAN